MERVQRRPSVAEFSNYKTKQTLEPVKSRFTGLFGSIINKIQDSLFKSENIDDNATTLSESSGH
jgi:hypothetical protein